MSVDFEGFVFYGVPLESFVIVARLCEKLGVVVADGSAVKRSTLRLCEHLRKKFSIRVGYCHGGSAYSEEFPCLIFGDGYQSSDAGDNPEPFDPSTLSQEAIEKGKEIKEYLGLPREVRWYVGAHVY